MEDDSNDSTVNPHDNGSCIEPKEPVKVKRGHVSQAVLEHAAHLAHAGRYIASRTLRQKGENVGVALD